MTHADSHPRPVSGWIRRAPVLALALLPLLVACDVSARAGAPRTGFSTSGDAASIVDPSLVGTWRRSLLLRSSAGALLRTETLWTFRLDGSATRVVEAFDFGRGRLERFVAHARWTIVDGAVSIDWRAPLGGSLLLPYRVTQDGSSVILGSDLFVRVR